MIRVPPRGTEPQGWVKQFGTRHYFLAGDALSLCAEALVFTRARIDRGHHARRNCAQCQAMHRALVQRGEVSV